LTFYSLAKIDASATHTSKTVSSRCLYLRLESTKSRLLL
jgi:hypothetical protein